MAEPVRRADHQVVILIPRVVGPQVARPDGQRPVDGSGQAVGAIEHAHQPVFTGRGGTIAFALVAGGDDPAPPDGAGKAPAQKAQAHRRDDQVLWRHGRCPDFAALVAR